jgi:nicotinamidase-related amidase
MKHVEPVRNWPLTPSATAILVVDVQRSEVQPELLATQQAYARSLERRMLPALARLVASARASGCEVVYTVTEALTRDGRERGLDHRLADILVPRGSPLAETLPEAGRREDDLLLRKTSAAVFAATNLDYLLRNLGIRHVVDSAVRDGADLGYYMVCAADACVARTETLHAQALAAFGGYCRVQQVDEILSDLGAAA